jgi:hypothetical protein
MTAKTETWIIKHKIDEDGIQHWYKNDELHRDDGPAVVFPDGTQIWYKNGKLHRDDGPAIINGIKMENGIETIQVEHNGPARILASGTQYWYQNGKCHREDGPAIINVDGSEEYFINGIKFDPSN